MIFRISEIQLQKNLLTLAKLLFFMEKTKKQKISKENFCIYLHLCKHECHYALVEFELTDISYFLKIELKPCLEFRMHFKVDIAFLNIGNIQTPFLPKFLLAALLV